MNAPRVSIVMPVFNRAWCVAEAVDSVLATGEPDLELVVVDDGSTDGTADILARYAQREPRVRVVAHPGRANRGIARSRNLGVAQAHGSYIAFLDSDDLYRRNRFAHALPWLDSHPDVAGCVEPFETADMAGGECRTSTHLTTVAPADCGWLRAMLFSTVYWQTGAITLRRTALARFGGFDARMQLGEDVDLWLKLASAGAVGVAQSRDPVCTVRRHGSHSWSGSGRATQHAVYLKVLHSLCRWIDGQRGLAACARPLARERLRQSLVELILDESLPRGRRAWLWAHTAARHPGVALSRRVTGNLARVLLGMPLWT